MLKNKSPDKKKSPAARTARGGRVDWLVILSTFDIVAQSVTHCQELTNKSYLPIPSDCTTQIDNCLYDTPAIDALLLQATARMQAAPDDETWQKHFRIWRSVHRLKAREEVTP